MLRSQNARIVFVSLITYAIFCLISGFGGLWAAQGIIWGFWIGLLIPICAILLIFILMVVRALVREWVLKGEK